MRHVTLAVNSQKLIPKPGWNHMNLTVTFGTNGSVLFNYDGGQVAFPRATASAPPSSITAWVGLSTSGTRQQPVTTHYVFVP